MFLTAAVCPAWLLCARHRARNVDETTLDAAPRLRLHAIRPNMVMTVTKEAKIVYN